MLSKKTYTTLTGITLDLNALKEEEFKALSAVAAKYNTHPEWTDFAAWWMKEINRRKIDQQSMLYRICDDLEARLGIAQGKASPPDYRHYLLALIEEEYGSRYKFCKQIGIDQGQLSRILSGKANFSMDTLSKVLSALHASIVVRKDDSLRELSSPEEAIRILECSMQ